MESNAHFICPFLLVPVSAPLTSCYCCSLLSFAAFLPASLLSASPFFLHPPSCILTLSLQQPSSPSPLSFPWVALCLLIFCLYGPFPIPLQPTQLTPSNSYYFRRSAKSPVVHLLSKVYHTEWQENTLTKTHLSQYNSFIFLKLYAFFKNCPTMCLLSYRAFMTLEKDETLNFNEQFH